MEALTVILAIIFGTGLFILINTIFNMWYLGFGAMVGEWFSCVVLAGILVQLLGGLVGGLFSVIWFLIKTVIIITIIGGVGILIYNKITGNKELE